jgi:hypothetical protein
MLKKKSYFLSIDAFIAIGVIFLGVLLFYSEYSFKTYDTQHEFYSRDILNSMINPLPDYNVQYYTEIGKYKDEGILIDPSLSLIEHLGRLFILNGTNCNNCFNISKNITLDVIKDRLPKDLSLRISLFNSTQDNEYYLYNNETISLDNAKTIATSQKLVAVVENDEFHLFNFRVLVWS